VLYFPTRLILKGHSRSWAMFDRSYNCGLRLGVLCMLVSVAPFPTCTPIEHGEFSFPAPTL